MQPSCARGAPPWAPIPSPHHAPHCPHGPSRPSWQLSLALPHSEPQHHPAASSAGPARPCMFRRSVSCVSAGTPASLVWEALGLYASPSSWLHTGSPGGPLSLLVSLLVSLRRGPRPEPGLQPRLWEHQAVSSCGWKCERMSSKQSGPSPEPPAAGTAQTCEEERVLQGVIQGLPCLFRPPVRYPVPPSFELAHELQIHWVPATRRTQISGLRPQGEQESQVSLPRSSIQPVDIGRETGYKLATFVTTGQPPG